MLKIKRDEAGNIERYKARLVALGFLQKKGRDFAETFSPTPQVALLQTMLAIAAEKDLETDHVDIKTAFLNGDIDCELYIRLPDGSCRQLLKGLYGLKQAGRLWNKKFHHTLISLGFKRCQNDPCCYVLRDDIVLIMHVDDCIIFGASKERIKRFKIDLAKVYKIKDLGPIKFALEWEIKRDRVARTLTINQMQNTLDVLKKFNMMNQRTASTPAFPNMTYSKIQCPKTEEEKLLMRKTPYLQALGSLIYLSVSTRPDISQAVSVLAQYASNPGQIHWEGIVRIFKYLLGTAGYGLSYGHLIDDKQLRGFSDASYGNCVDTRRSRYGGMLLVNNGPVEWTSKLTQIVTLSSMEAEYIGACELVRTAVWLRRCMGEVGFVQNNSTAVGYDNKSSIIFANEAMVQNRSKHIDTRYHYVREKIADKSVRLFYLPTKEMPADLLTKPLGVGPFEKCRKSMGLLKICEDRD